MSEPISESIPTSQDPRSKRPTKRRALTPLSEQASQIDHLFKDPSKEVRLPNPSKQRTAAALPPPPEVVANVQGSSAGAGSGEFHVYKASRRREYERVRLMDEELKKEHANDEFERKREEMRRKDEDKTEKNRKRREKKKAARGKKDAAPIKSVPGSFDVDMGTNGVDSSAVQDKTKEQSGQTTENGRDDQAHEERGVIIHDDD